MDVTISMSDVIAGVALLLSAFATWKTVKFNERQKSLIESQDQLNRRLLEKEVAELTGAQKADLGASFVKLGSSKYRFKVFNKGKAAARNVRIAFPDGDDPFIQSDVDEKFPHEALEQHQSVELIAAVHMGTKSKHHVVLTWDDDSGSNHSKSIYPTL